MAERPGEGALELEGRVALVTGASRGLGEGIARRLARMGARVGCLARTGTDLDPVVASIEAAGGFADAVEVDVTDRSALAAALDAYQDAVGPVHVLVNNAGGNVRRRAEAFSLGEWDGLIALALTAPFQLAQAVFPGMRAEGFGRIVNVSSVAGLTALPTGAPYAAAKAGLNQLTRNLAREWGPHGITVNAVAPWYVRTPLTEGVLSDDAFRETVLRETPTGRIGTVEDVAEAVAFLCRPSSAWVNGVVLPLDGGFMAASFHPPATPGVE